MARGKETILIARAPHMDNIRYRDFWSTSLGLCVAEIGLVPLTDPLADAFVESIKKLKPYEEPQVVSDPAHHGDKLRIVLPERY